MPAAHRCQPERPNLMQIRRLTSLNRCSPPPRSALRSAATAPTSGKIHVDSRTCGICRFPRASAMRERVRAIQLNRPTQPGTMLMLPATLQLHRLNRSPALNNLQRRNQSFQDEARRRNRRLNLRTATRAATEAVVLPSMGYDPKASEKVARCHETFFDSQRLHLATQNDAEVCASCCQPD